MEYFAKDAGSHEAIVTLLDGYKWEDGYEQPARIFKWNIFSATLSSYTDDVWKIYDGEPLQGNATIEGLQNDEVLVVEPESSITDVGSAVNTYKASWNNPETTAKEKNYIIEKAHVGSLVVSKRPITLKSQSEEKFYDGITLKNSEILELEEGWAEPENKEPEGANYNVIGNITNVGSALNTFSYLLKENTKASNYEIKVEFGTLRILMSQMTIDIFGNTLETEYNGEEQKVVGYTAAVNEKYKKIFDTEKISVNYDDCIASGTDARTGAYTMHLANKAWSYKDANVNCNFNIKDGWIHISKAKIKIDVKGKYDTRFYNHKTQQLSGYTAELHPSIYDPNEKLFDNSKVKYKTDLPKAEGDVPRDDPYSMNLETNNFYYDSPNVSAEFNIVDGWLKIISYEEYDKIIKISGDKIEKVYNNSQYSASYTAQGYTQESTFNVDYNKLSLSKGVIDCKRTNAGTTIAHITDSTQYEFVYNEPKSYCYVENDISLTVTPILINIPSPITNLIYNGLEQNAFPGVTNPIEISNNIQTKANYPDNPYYTAAAKLKDENNNYAWNLPVPKFNDQDIPWKINRLEAVITWNNPENIIYTGASILPIAKITNLKSNNRLTTDEVNVEVVAFTSVSEKYDCISAGSQKAMANALTGADSTNYVLPDSEKAKLKTFEIAPRPVGINWNNENNRIYL